MATEQNILGFEMLGFGEAKWAGTSVNIGMTTPSGSARPGSGPGRFQLTTQNSTTNLIIFPARAIVGTSGTVTSGNHKRVRSRIFFRIDSVRYPFGNSFIRIFGIGGEFDTNQVGVWLDAQNQLTVSVLSGTPANSGSGWSGSHTAPLTVGVWYSIILDVDLNVSSNTLVTANMTVVRDASSDVPVTITATGNIGASDQLLRLCFCSERSRGSFDCSGTFSYDDWVYMAASNADAVSGLTLPTADHIFPVVPPTGILSRGGWTGSNTDVDEYPVNGSDFINSSGAAGDEMEFTHDSGIALGIGQAHAIKLYVNGLVTGGGSGSCDFMLAGTATNVTLGTNYPDTNGASDPVGGLMWQPNAPLASLAFAAVSMGVRKQNAGQSTNIANLGLEVLGVGASYSSGNQIRGASQIKAGSVYDAQISDAANIARHKIQGLSDGSAVVLNLEDAPQPDDWVVPALPGSPAAAVRIPVVPVFFPDSDQIEEMPMGGGGGGSAGTAGPTGPQGPAGFGGGLVLLNEQAVSAVSSVDFSSRNIAGFSGVLFQSDFDEYEFHIVSMVAGTSAAALNMRCSSDGGVTFDSTAGHYSWENFAMAFNATGVGGSQSDTAISIANNMNNAAGTSLSTRFQFYDPLNTANYRLIAGHGNQTDSSRTTDSLGVTFASKYRVTGGGTAVNAVRFLMSSGTMTGTIRCYGVMKSQNPITTAVTGALVFLQQQVANNSSALDFTNFITSQFDEYVIELLGIVPVTNGAIPRLRFSTNNGSSYDSGNNYASGGLGFSSSGSAISGSQAMSFVPFLVNPANGINTGVAASGSMSGTLKLFLSPAGTLYARFTGSSSYIFDTGSPAEGAVWSGAYLNTTQPNAFEFSMSSGNFSGTIRVYGVVSSGSVMPAALLTGPWASRPSALVNGRLYLPSDGFTLGRDNGASWDTFGPMEAFTPPSDTGFGWRNQGSSTLTIDKDRLLLNAAAAGNAVNMVARVIAAPATPYTITAYLVPVPISKLFNGYGLIFRQNGAGTGTGRIVTMWWAGGNFAGSTQPTLRIEKWSSETAVSASYAEFLCQIPPSWFRIQDTGVNTVFFISTDGQNWTQLFSVSRTDYMLQGPDQVGFFGHSMNAATPNLDVPVNLLSWKQT
jgi:hypothetical protein